MEAISDDMLRLNGRLTRLEAEVRTRDAGRFAAACRALAATMAPEHLDLLRAWHRTPEAAAEFQAHPVARWAERLTRLEIPPLVRAAYELAIAHTHSGSPPALPEVVGQVYTEHVRTSPRDTCTVCGYPAPMQFHASEPFAVFFQTCPLCDGATAYARYAET